MTDQISLQPAHTALLVMDYQVELLERFADPDPLLTRVSAAIADVRAHGGQVGWVRVGFDDADLDAIPTTSVMARMATPDRREALHPDAAGTQIHDRLHPHPQDVVVRKVRVGAFTTTDLDQQLRTRGITTLVLAGISTSGVVLSTVREAMDRDYRILVLEDASADPDLETHAFLMSRVFPRHTTVIDVSSLRALWE